MVYNHSWDEDEDKNEGGDPHRREDPEQYPIQQPTAKSYVSEYKHFRHLTDP